MPVEKQLNIIPNSNTATPINRINDGVLAIDDLIPPAFKDNIPDFLTKIMQAVALGVFTLSRQQSEALRLLFDKKVPSAPKELIIDANVKSVDIVVHEFLQSNKDNMNYSLSLAEKQAAIEAQYAYLEEELNT